MSSSRTGRTDRTHKIELGCYLGYSSGDKANQSSDEREPRLNREVPKLDAVSVQWSNRGGGKDDRGIVACVLTYSLQPAYSG